MIEYPHINSHLAFMGILTSCAQYMIQNPRYLINISADCNQSLIGLDYSRVEIAADMMQ